MSIANGLSRLGFVPLVDFIAQDDGNGPYVASWMSELSQPTDAEIAAAAALPPVVAVPVSVTPLQMRKALRAAGLKAQADAYLATLPAETQEAWEYASEIMRNDAFIEGARIALGMTSAQADDLFILADSL